MGVMGVGVFTTKLGVLGFSTTLMGSDGGLSRPNGADGFSTTIMRVMVGGSHQSGGDGILHPPNGGDAGVLFTT